MNTNYISYLNSINSAWVSKIATTTWKVGGGTDGNMRTSSTAKTAYTNEIVTNASTTYSAKIGLIYLSDYYYAASPTYWSYLGYGSAAICYHSAKGAHWMYMGENEWTISRNSGGSSDAFFVTNGGHTFSHSGFNNRYAVRPAFYLESNVEYELGDGSLESPIRIKLS